MNKQRIKQLAALTGEAMLGHDGAVAPRSPRRGDLYVLDRPGEAAVEWLVIGDEPDVEGRLLAVAADTRPLRGRADVAVDDESLGPLTLRCAVSSRIHGQDLAPELCTGRVSQQSLTRVDEVRGALAAKTPLPGSTPRRQDTGDELEYRQWIAELEKTRADLGATAPGRSHPRSRRIRLRGFSALAALVIGAVAASLFWRQTPAVDELAGPVANPPLALLTPSSTERGVSQSLRIPADAPFVVVILGLDDAPAFERYRLEVKDPETSELTWSSSELVRTEVAELSVALPRRMAVGEHTLVLHGLRGGRAELLARYVLNVELVGE